MTKTPHRIVEVTNYYAKSGMAAAVLKMRRRGTRLRLELGLPPGRILIGDGASGPDVRWDCSFISREVFETDLATRDTSPEFVAQRRQMGALLDRFERHVMVEDQEAGNASDAVGADL